MTTFTGFAPAVAMKKALPLLQQYVGCSLVSVKAEGVTQPWPLTEALACERLELVFSGSGPALILAAAGEDHFYGEADLILGLIKLGRDLFLKKKHTKPVPIHTLCCLDSDP